MGEGSTQSKEVEHVPAYKMAVAVGLYSLCSGTMLIVNKLTMYHIPFAGCVILIQVPISQALITYS